MILADTSVWIDYFNGQVSPQTDLLDSQLKKGNVVMGDIILLEILQGIRDNRQYQLVKRNLSLLDSYAMMSPEKATVYADFYRTLRKRGITIRKTNDVIIAGFCIESQVELLFSDRDFLPFVQYLGLKTASPDK